MERYVPVAYHNGKVIYKSFNGYHIKGKTIIYPSAAEAEKAIERSRSYDI